MHSTLHLKGACYFSTFDLKTGVAEKVFLLMSLQGQGNILYLQMFAVRECDGPFVDQSWSKSRIPCSFFSLLK